MFEIIEIPSLVIAAYAFPPGKYRNLQQEVVSKVILTANHKKKSQKNAKLIVSKSNFTNFANNLSELCG
jgi:hypothetical protein